MNTDWLQDTLLDNSWENILRFSGILIAGFALKRFVANQLSNILYSVIRKKVEGVHVDELRSLLKKPSGILILLVTVYLAAQQLHYPTQWSLPDENTFGLRMFIWRTFQISTHASITWMVLRIVDFFGIVLLTRARRTISNEDDQLIPFVKDSLKFIVLLFSIFIALGSILEVNVASLIAGLGIGGIAIALAAKDTIENLLGSFTIFLDKPFTVGDQVRIGSSNGKVERIGFRSTQIRTQEKTLITVPNKKMIDMEVENISLRQSIRASYPLTLHYDTGAHKTEQLCAALQSYLNGREDVEKDPSPIIRIERLSDS
ncbi:MAG: hypothetical protein RLZZ630_1371, partial [Bacteroidota bacterium]